MKTNIVKSLIGISFVLLAGTQAQAQQNIAMGASTSPPIGWVQFCQAQPNDCVNQSMDAKTIALNERSWKQIVKINADVNGEIEPISDQDHWGQPEVWSYPTDGKGDCEDYVLEKRRRLVKAGFPVQALLITVVRDLKGDGHAVLTVKTDRGDFVLDNQVSKILAWRDTGYRFIKRQADDNPVRWVSLGGVDTRMVASQR